MENFDFNALGLTELSNLELQGIEGGGWVDFIIEKAIELLLYCAVETHERATLFDAPQGVWLWQ